MRVSAPWLDDPGAVAVTGMLAQAGHQALFVGGCVRNALLGAPVSDLDIATDARPERVMALAQAAGLRALPTGIDHGTVTVLAHETPFEITTFRRDVATDGRRAVVAFAQTPDEDARRRDFTMNALYCDSAGQVIDPLGGLADLRARRVRFIGDPAQRIREDYLRILRFFRFYAWYGGDGIDPEGLAACAALAGGMEGLARERIGQEMRKLLAAPNPAPSLGAMQQAGVLMRCLPGADMAAVAVLVHAEESLGLAPDPLRRLAALGGQDVAEALRLARAEARQLAAMVAAVGGPMGAPELGYRLGADMARDVLLLRAAPSGQMPEAADLAAAQGGAAQAFPVVAADLMPGYSGAALGARLKDLEQKWIESGFTLNKAALLRFS